MNDTENVGPGDDQGKDVAGACTKPVGGGAAGRGGPAAPEGGVR